MISHRFVVYGVQDGYLEVGEATEVEVRCSHCGVAQPFADDGDSAYLNDLLTWAEAHKCHRGQTTNTTGRQTDRPTNAPRSITEAESFRIEGVMTGRLRTNIKQDGQPDLDQPHVMHNAMIQGTAMDLDTTRIKQAMESQEPFHGVPVVQVADMFSWNPSDWAAMDAHAAKYPGAAP